MSGIGSVGEGGSKEDQGLVKEIWGGRVQDCQQGNKWGGITTKKRRGGKEKKTKMGYFRGLGMIGLRG